MSDVAERVKKIVVEHLGVDADKVKAPKTTAVDSEAAHEAKNRALVRESNKGL